MINWLKSISNKTKARFIKLDIVESYPSITEKLLDNVIFYAQTLTIPDDAIQLIKQARKSLLFTEENIWMKKVENALSDVTMGSQDRAEVCELIGIYLLGKLSNIIDKKKIGVHRDDGLHVIENANGP